MLGSAILAGWMVALGADGGPNARADARRPGAVPLSAALDLREPSGADGLARAGHTIDLGRARAGNEAAKTILCFTNLPLVAEMWPPLTAMPILITPQWPLVVTRTMFQFPSNLAAVAGAAKQRVARMRGSWPAAGLRKRRCPRWVTSGNGGASAMRPVSPKSRH